MLGVRINISAHIQSEASKYCAISVVYSLLLCLQNVLPRQNVLWSSPRLAILSNFPETTHPRLYSSLLPTIRWTSCPVVHYNYKSLGPRAFSCSPTTPPPWCVPQWWWHVPVCYMWMQLWWQFEGVAPGVSSCPRLGRDQGHKVSEAVSYSWYTVHCMYIL